MEPAPLQTAAELRDELRSRIFRHFAPVAGEVLGFKLAPFTLWHWRTLDVLQSPFAPDSLAEIWEDHDLAIAARIASLEPHDPQTFDLTRSTRWRMLYQLRKNRVTLPIHAHALNSHIADACGGPARWVKSGGVPVKCPVWLYIAAALVKHGWSERDAWAKTPGEARCWLGAMDVAEGGTDFLDEQDVLTALASGYSREDIGL